MRRIYLFLSLLLSLVGTHRAWALDVPSGVMDLGDAVTTLETGKWYFLYNNGTQKYARENASNGLKATTSPAGKSVSGNEGYLVTLEDAGSGKYYLKTGLGNYYKLPGSSANGTSATKTGCEMTVTLIEGTTNQYALKGNGIYNMVVPNSGSDLKGGTNTKADGIGAWTFYNVAAKSESELTGEDLYNYQMRVLGLIRIHNKRTSTAYLTTTENGVAKGAAKAATGMSQIWILEKSGAGYTMRSANTGQYIQSSFDAPAGNATTLYFQFSPNNTGTESYCNISSSSNFSGQTCMNLGNNGTTVTKWSYANDAGSDWAIELVEDITEEDVRNHMNAAKGFVGELESGAYYRIYNTSYGLYMTESDAYVRSIGYIGDNYAQCWQVTKSGSGFAFKNVLSERYIQTGTGTSQQYKTAKNSVALYPAHTDDKWEFKWTIANALNGTVGLHTDASKNVVQWNTSAAASEWAFQKIELSEEEIEAARASVRAYEEIVANLSTYQAHLDNLFEDKACTTLKSNIASLSDEALAANADYAALNADMKAMVLKIKNDTWKQYTNKTTGYTAGYEKFFRIADYKIYSNCDEMWQKFVMSNPFGRLSGPTGIVANAGDIVYIYVDADPLSECKLDLEVVTTDGVAGNHATGSLSTLKKGLNVYSPSQQVMLYILHQLNNTDKYLADYPDIKIHIEGGQLNGYWDATRGMTNADWKLLQQDLLKASPFLNLKTKHLVFQMDTDLVLAAEPDEMEGLMRIWEAIPTNEDRYMGVEEFEGRYNNIWNVYSGASMYMHATNRGTWYNESTIPTVMNYNKMRQAGSIWGPSHEIGHNHQNTINLCGATESSNNLFSNINTFEQGIRTSRCYLPSDNFNALVSSITNNKTTYKSIPWSGRDIWNTTRMFFQLYLYFHVMHHDDQFYPNLFRALRKNPINKRSGWDSTTEYTYTEKGETKTGTGANITYGRLDYLHFAKTVCDVAQADLSEFFESYGMFVPVKDFFVGDYANYLVTTTQKDIDDAKKYMQKYPKKLGNIMFIDDHVMPMKDANPDNIFEGLPASDGKKTNNLEQHNSSLPVGDVGNYEVFDGHEEYLVEKDRCTVSGTTITFQGNKDYIGHKFYDKDGNLVWATNAKSATLPASVRALGIENLTIVTAESNLNDIPCPYFKRSSNFIYPLRMYFGSEESTKLWYTGMNHDLNQYIPENAFGVLDDVLGTSEAVETPALITSATNVITKEGTADNIVINGDKPAFIPADAQAAKLKFTKANDGYAALQLPFEVKSESVPGLKIASYEGGVLTLTDTDHVGANRPAVVNGAVDLSLSDVFVTKGSYQEQKDIKVLASDGKSVVDASTASPFTFDMQQATAIQSVSASEAGSQPERIYDLQGRRIERVTRPGLYIQGGKKVIVRN